MLSFLIIMIIASFTLFFSSTLLGFVTVMRKKRIYYGTIITISSLVLTFIFFIEGLSNGFAYLYLAVLLGTSLCLTGVFVLTAGF
ncbi:hypothetical protein HLI_02540 [Halobacillus litoralis]|uniref:Uncharacterized protein n=1 Tax=Halobacillus litoralis TaxID=45668 RepID=A0A410M8Y6_9BACI|nr:hypothetical protein HLI_02540 [Halobacillus litoralis]